jgi:hypothetical protein
MDRGLFGLTFEEAREVVLKRRLDESVTYPIMTKQAIAIGTKIAEVDALLTERPKRRDGWWRFILSCLSCGSRRPLDPRSLTDSRGRSAPPATPLAWAWSRRSRPTVTPSSRRLPGLVPM